MQPAAVVALEIEEKRELVRGVRRPQDGDFPVGESRKRDLRPAGVIGGRRQRTGLDESEKGRRQEADGEPGTVPEPVEGPFRSAFRQAQGPTGKQNPTCQQDSQQMQQRAVFAESVEDEELQVAEPDGCAEDGTAEDEHHRPEEAVQGAVLRRLPAQENETERQQDIGHGGGQADGDAPEHIGPGAPHHTVTPAARAAAHHPHAGQGVEQHPSGEREAGGAKEQRHGLEPAERHRQYLFAAPGVGWAEATAAPAG